MTKRGRYLAINVAKAPRFEVAVSNIGSVYRGPDEIEANEFFDIYVALSIEGASRAADESVTLFQDGSPERQFIGAAETIDDWRERGLTKLEAKMRARFGAWDGFPPAFKQRLIALTETGR